MELSNFGDHAQASLKTNASGNSAVGIEGSYHAVCRDAQGNVKWEEGFPNLVVASGKQLMLDTFLSGTAYTTVGPFIGLINGASPQTFSASDTIASHPGWTEFTNYNFGGSNLRGTVPFNAATSTGVSPTNVTTKASNPTPGLVFTITGSGGTVAGCFIVTGAGASSTPNSTGGVLYSAGAFGTAKTVTIDDTITVSYWTSATS